MSEVHRERLRDLALSASFVLFVLIPSDFTPVTATGTGTPATTARMASPPAGLIHATPFPGGFSEETAP